MGDDARGVSCCMFDSSYSARWQLAGDVFIIDIAHIYLGHAGRLFFSFILMYRQQSKLLSWFPFLSHLFSSLKNA